MLAEASSSPVLPLLLRTDPAGRADEAIADAVRRAGLGDLSPAMPEPLVLSRFQRAADAIGRGEAREAAAELAWIAWQCPGFAPGWAALGLALMGLRMPGAAASCQRNALALAPDFADAQFNLASALCAGGAASASASVSGALDACRRAVQLAPGFARAWMLLARLLQDDGQPAEALRAADLAGALAPEAAEAHFRRGNALYALARYSDAIDAYGEALRRQPDLAEAMVNLSCAWQARGGFEEAVLAARRAISLRAEDAAAHRALGTALQALGAFEAALAAYRAGLACRPDDPDLLGLVGAACTELNRLAEADQAFVAALSGAPENTDLHFNRSLALLKAGRWREGWAEHEWRWRGLLQPHGIDAPLWRGEELHGRRILLHAEQGLGDTLHFIRYVPAVRARGGTVVVEVQPPLQRLMRQSLPPDVAVIAAGAARPAVDSQCSLMSLPHVFGTDATAVPHVVPYLRADAADLRQWRQRLAAFGPAGLRIGLVWAGSPRPGEIRSHQTDRRRSLSRAQLAPLGAVPGPCWFSLQLGPAAAQRGCEPSSPADQADDWPVHDLTHHIHDMADTAALVAALDLVVAVDTSVAHLAGALGKPVWMLSRFDGCWRWLAEGVRTAWYPTMRIYRQTAPGEWRDPIRRMENDLRRQVGHFANPR